MSEAKKPPTEKQLAARAAAKARILAYNAKRNATPAASSGKARTAATPVTVRHVGLVEWLFS